MYDCSKVGLAAWFGSMSFEVGTWGERENDLEVAVKSTSRSMILRWENKSLLGTLQEKQCPQGQPGPLSMKG